MLLCLQVDPQIVPAAGHQRLGDKEALLRAVEEAREAYLVAVGSAEKAAARRACLAALRHFAEYSHSVLRAGRSE